MKGDADPEFLVPLRGEPPNSAAAAREKCWVAVISPLRRRAGLPTWRGGGARSVHTSASSLLLLIQSEEPGQLMTHADAQARGRGDLGLKFLNGGASWMRFGSQPPAEPDELVRSFRLVNVE